MLLPAKLALAQGSDSGAQVYDTTCAACHQPSGAGVAGGFPPLAGHFPELLGQKDGRSYVVDVVLFGLEGGITIAVDHIDGAMPSWAALSDDDLAGVLNYVGSAWDNKKALPAGFTSFTAADIKAARAQHLSPAAVRALRPGEPPPAQTATAPVSFTDEQAARGKSIYTRRCADCHGSGLDNGEFGGPPLNGSYFKQHWGNGSVAALVAYAKAKMPPDRPGGLSDESYADVVAYLLHENGYEAADKELPVDLPSQLGMSLQHEP